MTEGIETLILPVVEEYLVVDKRSVATGTVRVRTVVDTQPVTVRDHLVRGGVEVERRAIDREVAEVPPVRDEGDTIIVPIVREEIVVTKRLILVEEVRLRRTVENEEFTQTVAVRTQRPVIERD